MKNLKKISIVGIVLIMVSLHSSKLFAASEGDIKSTMEDEGWTFATTIYADLTQGQSCTWWYREFHANLEYKIVAFSEDDDVNDVYLRVQYPHGTSFVSDYDDMAVVNFNCYDDQQLRIAITNSSSDTPHYASRCKFMIFYKEI